MLPISLRRRLRSNALQLKEAFRALNVGIRKGDKMTPAAVWFLDSFFIVDEHIKAVRRDLPPGFYKELPKLSNGSLRGHPRVYGLVVGLIAHSDNRFDLDTLLRYCRAYQRVQPLSIGELWAVAITLRIVLIENLSRAASGIVARLILRENADALADKLLAPDGPDGAKGIADAPLPDGKPLLPAFAAQLFQRLRDQDPSTTPTLNWLHERLASQGTSADEVIQTEHHQQGAVNLSVRNIITSLRLISSVDWARFFESISLVDEILRNGSKYATFDFATRDLYRHAIENLSRHSRHTEQEVALLALAAAQRNPSPEASAHAAPSPHSLEPGYYLVAAGRHELEQELGYRPPWKERRARAISAAGIGGYLGGVGAFSAALALVLLAFLRAAEAGLVYSLVLLLLGVIAASDIGMAIVNLWVTRFCRPRVLPGLELKDGVPAELRTVIAIPILLTTLADIEEYLRNLEVHFLATQEGDIRFALLSDWLDASSENASGDEELLAAARAGITRLNQLHGSPYEGPRFFLFHRRRLWNGTQRRWMGWERKRGKLHEFNRLLRGSTQTSFVGLTQAGTSLPANVSYIISLDADTRLPRGAAVELIGKMAHPLNIPIIDAVQRRVTAGYGILQPRVTPSLPQGPQASLYQAISSGPSGIDPYAFAVSDVYQDLFEEGSYSGKGIYDIDAFEATMGGRVPENRLLSHDLFEGIYARSGFASDVEVIEEYPARYGVASARQHRWTRGDWQLLPWIIRSNPTLNALGRWKMFDNLRRSLIVPVVLMGLILSWLGSIPVAGSVFFLGAIVLPVMLPFSVSLLTRLADLTRITGRRSLRGELAQVSWLVGLKFVFLTDQTWVMADAISRTLYRVFVSHRNLLQWRTTAQSQIGSAATLHGYYRQMLGGLGLVLLAALILMRNASREALLIALPCLALWCLAPWVAYRVSRPRGTARRETLTPEERRELRLQARQTWSFFDTFVTGKQNMLPPDNFQEIPKPIVATRTSPTNIGLYLLSIAAAREFGWIGTGSAITRLEDTFTSLDKLEKFRGHFYNWYDTQDLRPLDPRYISTVDSGNLAGHLLAVAGAARAWQNQRVTPETRVRGIRDTLELVQDSVRALEKKDERSYGISPQELRVALDALGNSLEVSNATIMPEFLASALIRAEAIAGIAEALNQECGANPDSAVLAWSRMLSENIRSHQLDLHPDVDNPADPTSRLEALAHRAEGMAFAMEFAFLVQPERQLLSIGYRVADRAQDPSCYDLLASEARLASFFGIATGDLPVRHWFRLGRRLTPVDHSAALVSWSGSMFEYLMPVLVMQEPEGSVLGETAQMIVRRQIEYGRERGLPWGVSESALNARDREFTYQYSSFGVPGLGLQRGLGEQAVVAPYASALAAMIDPKAALTNFERLQALGGRGRYGWYDALDFTPSRLPDGQSVVPVRAYMAHHQGMILISAANVLMDGVFRHYFHSNAVIQATELLLQEKTLSNVDLSTWNEDEHLVPEVRDLAAAAPRRFTSPHQSSPRTHVLSNGQYSVMVTTAGSGFSRWRDLAVTRWHEDVTRDPWGAYIFLRDVVDGEVWSAGYQPMGKEPDSYLVEFFEDRAEITRRDGPIVTSTEILVSPEDNAEVRRVSLTNESSRVREIELTSYAEIVLAPSDADAAHPAFSKLFVQTEFIAESGALLATRRGRDPAEPQPWVALVSALEGDVFGGLQFETDRARFLGRGHELRNAVSIVDARPLSGTVGTVLDPVLCLRRRIRVAPGETARVAFWTSISASRAEALALIDKHRDMAAFDRAKTLAWTQAQVQLRYLGIDFAEAQQFQRIANRVLYTDSSLRAPRDVLEKNQQGQSALWPHGISGDLPIVLIRIDDQADIEMVRQLLRAQEYWWLKRLAVDLVILNEHPTSYIIDLQNLIDTAVRNAQARHDEDRRGGIFLLRADVIADDARDLLQSVARAIFVARRGTLSDQLARVREAEPKPRRRLSSKRGLAPADAAPSAPELKFFNGLGGFTESGREYVVVLDEGQWTPAPWTNVVANAQFGFLVSADGAGATWSLNAQQNRLTPWSNDPIANVPSEAIYIRDDESGDLWSATPLPIRQAHHTYVVRHGLGFSQFQHNAHGISLDLKVFVPLHDSVKISHLKITNRSGRARQLSCTNYVDWVLGTQRSKSASFIVTELDPSTHALFSRNPWSIEYSSRIAFIDMGGRQHSMTADRTEFLGRHGSLAEPSALLDSAPLQNRIGAGCDPCGALQSKISLAAGATIEITFLLGEAPTREAAVELIQRYRTSDPMTVLQAVGEYWDRTVSMVQVKTPDRSMDILLNSWLLYQTLACRVWARTGFYQSSGAYGFRDQLQDIMALCVCAPAVAREHILRAAGRQFEAGDVQHWWLPGNGQGVRTRVSDDRIWLPYVTAHYLEVTGDVGVLDVPIAYLSGDALAPHVHEVFSTPQAGPEASLFEHCVRALDSSLAIGSHGLPLFGTGDWNDGMNRVGQAGRGESVWLAWFLHATLLRFAPIAQDHGAQTSASQWRKHAFALQSAVEREAWDGDWYRRGYFDDGSALGSATSDECRIDSIAQSWGVISGAADAARAHRAMAAVDAQLVSRSEGLVQLFTPAFDRSAHDPGYIKAYPPGIRENGGQYTHAALWTVLAFAQLHDGDRAAELFSLINPINHGSARGSIHRYKVEPYVACADVYSAPAHIGRGGWTWYTGSASWMYRIALESILGIQVRGEALSISPNIPRSWKTFEVTYRHRSSRYRIAIENPQGVSHGILRATLDGAQLPSDPCMLPLCDDARDHVAVVTLGS